MTEQPAAQTVFHVVLDRLAAADLACDIEDDGKAKDEYWGAYYFGDGADLTWGATTDTGAENSAIHPVSSHGSFGAFYTDDDGDVERLFDTGDFDTDVADLLAWRRELADKHGRTQK
ncbi:hypothetical protein [Streptomyces sp. NPDC055140]